MDYSIKIALILSLAAHFSNTSEQTSPVNLKCSKNCHCVGTLVDCSRKEITELPNNLPDYAEKL